MVTLKDVAKACGMSVTQVSRALNACDDVSAKTIARVKRVASEMGYVKNLTAKSLSAKRASQIAVLVIGLGYIDEFTAFVMDTIMGVNRYAKEHCEEMVVHFVDKAPESYEVFCRQRGIGGVIILHVDYLERSYNQLLDSDFPAVCIDSPLAGRNKGCVMVDDVHYSKLAVRRLIAAGAKRIALVNGEAHSYTSQCRFQGYREALDEAGLPFDRELIVVSDYLCSKAMEDVSSLMTRHPDIDGIFCMSDYMAIGALNALNDLHINVPGQVALIGYDGLTMAEFTNPPIATIKQNHNEKGYRAAKMLTEMLDGTQTETHVCIPCKLVERGSIR